MSCSWDHKDLNFRNQTFSEFSAWRYEFKHIYYDVFWIRVLLNDLMFYKSEVWTILKHDMYWLCIGMGLDIILVRLKFGPWSISFGICIECVVLIFLLCVSFQKFPSWAGMKSVTQAKSMIGYALMLSLQVGVLEKFKSIPLITGLDLASFVGAVFVSSASLFILSKLSLDSRTTRTRCIH